jgi:hypothetical protein
MDCQESFMGERKRVQELHIPTSPSYPEGTHHITSHDTKDQHDTQPGAHKYVYES